jgi:pantoate--beta-alanine ligase
MFYLLNRFIQMKILYSNNDLIEALKNVSKLGFIPTMGSLHKGHLSLIQRAKKECHKTIVSIFVNPTQFNNKKDYKDYPRDNKKDLLILKKLRVNFVYIPTKKQIYKTKRNTKVKLCKKDRILCAKFRKGHFEGVLDIMDRLTKIIKPQKIYMGEKDLQQLYLVKKLIENKYNSLVVACKTVRDKNGLALSSRNVLLNNNELKKAGHLAKNLISFKKKLLKKRNIDKQIQIKKNYLENIYNVNIEYLELRNKINLKKNIVKNSRIFIAYNLNKIRLIDNF